MKPLFALGLALALAVAAGGADTHGVDMRTQAGPPGPEKYSPPFPVDPKLPTLWLIGDSTVRNGSKGDGTNLNQWGWGAPLTFWFDPAKVNVVNRALGGTSARSFYRNQWPRMAGLLKAGDVLLLQFGTNDGGPTGRGVGDLRGIGEETQGDVHTYGWYLRRFIAEARAHGATPIVCSLIPRKSWDESGHLLRAKATYAGWAAQVAAAEQAGFVDLNELSAERLDRLGRAATDRLYVPAGEHVHTGWDGAVLNAAAVVAGLRSLPRNPTQAWLRATP